MGNEALQVQYFVKKGWMAMTRTALSIGLFVTAGLTFDNKQQLE